jgi:uncharacterized protein YjbJ (UPF0337 family)
MREVSQMNWDQVQGKLKQAKGSMKQRWAKLTDDDITFMSGSRDQFVGRLQERYGIAKEEAEKQVEAWLKAENASETKTRAGGGSTPY